MLLENIILICTIHADKLLPGSYIKKCRYPFNIVFSILYKNYLSALCLSSFHSSSLSSLHFIYILLLLTHSSSTFYFNQLLKIFFVGFEVEASTLIGAFCFPFSAGCLRNLSYAPAYFLIFISHKK